MRDLNIILVQYEIAWHDSQLNRNVIDQLLADADLQWADLVVLPEMFTSGFTMDPQGVAETMKGPAVEWMTNLASRHNTTVIGSLALSEEGSFYNRLIAAHPDGTLTHYDKRHLFSYAGEHEIYTPGQHQVIITCGDGWKICPQVCYDLRFPVWSRNTEGYDVLIYVANWPAVRVDAWNTLLKARAIENLCYTIGVNRVGADKNGIEYPGSSRVYDMAGEALVSGNASQQVLTCSLNHASLVEFRSKYNFLADQDRFMIV